MVEHMGFRAPAPGSQCRSKGERIITSTDAADVLFRGDVPVFVGSHAVYRRGWENVRDRQR